MKKPVIGAKEGQPGERGDPEACDARDEGRGDHGGLLGARAPGQPSAGEGMGGRADPPDRDAQGGPGVDPRKSEWLALNARQRQRWLNVEDRLRG
jgi:hypothetical protein